MLRKIALLAAALTIMAPAFADTPSTGKIKNPVVNPPRVSEAGNQETPAALQANTRPYCVPPPISKTNAMRVWCPKP